MNIKCEVVRDLLPLYVDGVASEESRALIEEHLKECDECRKYCELLQEDLPDQASMDHTDEAASLKRIKRRMLLNKVLIVVVTLAFAAIAAVFIGSQKLTEYNGTLDENLSFNMLEGYEQIKEDNDDPDYASYARETASQKETIEIWYDGLNSGEEKNYSPDETITIDPTTEIQISRFDWDHGYDNALNFIVLHGDEAYTITYQCKETDKEKYYSSCSKEQQDEIVGFIKTFDFHRPDGSDKNVFQRLYCIFGAGGCILLALTILFFIGVPIAIGIAGAIGSKDGKDSDAVISSKDLHASMNRERKAKGETNIPSINTVQGASTSTLARRDHSWSSVPDFFIKMIKGKK